MTQADCARCDQDKQRWNAHRLEPNVAPMVAELRSDGAQDSLHVPSARRSAARDWAEQAREAK